MKFVYPIEGKSAEELYKLNREGFGGYYPIGLNNCYHGGIHLDGTHPIVAIADGTVIAYRYRKKYIEQENSGKTYRYTNGFVLIRMIDISWWSLPPERSRVEFPSSPAGAGSICRNRILPEVC